MNDDYSKETGRMMTILEDLGTDAPLTNEFYYILGRLPMDEQEAFVGIALATGMVTLDRMQRWIEFRKDLAESDCANASVTAKVYLPDMTDHLYERAYTTQRIRRLAEVMHKKGECPPEDLRLDHDLCDPAADCRKCWVDTVNAFLDPEKQGEHGCRT